VNFWESFFRFIKEILPTIATFMIGKRVGEEGKEKLRATKDALELELKRVRAREEVDQSNANKSDLDLVNDAIKSGLGKPDVPDSD
jgi:hypothetical protein